jgi:hypothetical protein
MIVGILTKQLAKRTLKNKKLLNSITKKAMSNKGKAVVVKGSEAKALNKAFKSAAKAPMTMAQKRALAKAQKAAAIANRKSGLL